MCCKVHALHFCELTTLYDDAHTLCSALSLIPVPMQMEANKYKAVKAGSLLYDATKTQPCYETAGPGDDVHRQPIWASFCAS